MCYIVIKSVHLHTYGDKNFEFKTVSIEITVLLGFEGVRDVTMCAAIRITAPVTCNQRTRRRNKLKNQRIKPDSQLRRVYQIAL